MADDHYLLRIPLCVFDPWSRTTLCVWPWLMTTICWEFRSVCLTRGLRPRSVCDHGWWPLSVEISALCVWPVVSNHALCVTLPMTTICWEFLSVCMTVVEDLSLSVTMADNRYLLRISLCMCDRGRGPLSVCVTVVEDLSLYVWPWSRTALYVWPWSRTSLWVCAARHRDQRLEIRWRSWHAS